MEDQQNSPPKSRETKTIPKDDPIPDLTKPPADASEFDKWKFQTTIQEQQSLVDRLKQQFELKQKEIQILSTFGPPSDNDSATIKSERKRINALTLQIDSFLSSSLNTLVDTPVYLFDTTETDWSNIASAIVPLTWDKFQALELQKKTLLKHTVEQPTESGSRQLISDTQSVPIGTSVFGADQEVDKPSPSRMHLVDLNDTNSSSDKPATKIPPQSVTSVLKDDSLHEKVDALTTLLTDLKTSQNQEALIKELAELKDRVAALEKKESDILLHCDSQAEKIIHDGIATLDAQRESDAANMMKTAQKMLDEVEKCQKQVPKLIDIVQTKLTASMDHMAKYFNGVLAENSSLRRTNALLLQMVTHTLQAITGTMEGPVEQIKLCTKLNIEAMEDLQTMYATPLPDCIEKEVDNVSAKLNSILARLPVPPSVPAGAPGGVKADDKVETLQTTDMIIDTTAGPSGTKDQGDTQQEDINADKGGTQDDKHNDEDETHNKQSENDRPISPPPKSPPQKSPPPKSPPQKSPPPKSPSKSPHLSPPKNQNPMDEDHSEEEILVYSPIKESDPLEVKDKKSKFFDSLEHAKYSSTESDPDPNQANPTGPSRPNFSSIINFRPLTDSDYKPFKTYNPPPTSRHNWDIPLTPNGEKYRYTLNFTVESGAYKELAAYYKNQQFFKKWTKPQVDTWSNEVVKYQKEKVSEIRILRI
ncbi:hypothetical protein L1887_01901 [Cichorium endivia]|nr:hypothetical protein L1887_01901 [Cichorium endivia]